MREGGGGKAQLEPTQHAALGEEEGETNDKNPHWSWQQTPYAL